MYYCRECYTLRNEEYNFISKINFDAFFAYFDDDSHLCPWPTSCIIFTDKIACVYESFSLLHGLHFLRFCIADLAGLWWSHNAIIRQIYFLAAFLGSYHKFLCLWFRNIATSVSCWLFSSSFSFRFGHGFVVFRLYKLIIYSLLTKLISVSHFLTAILFPFFHYFLSRDGRFFLCTWFLLFTFYSMVLFDLQCKLFIFD